MDLYTLMLNMAHVAKVELDEEMQWSLAHLSGWWGKPIVVFQDFVDALTAAGPEFMAGFERERAMELFHQAMALDTVVKELSDAAA